MGVSTNQQIKNYVDELFESTAKSISIEQLLVLEKWNDDYNI